MNTFHTRKNFANKDNSSINKLLWFIKFSFHTASGIYFKFHVAYVNSFSTLDSLCAANVMPCGSKLSGEIVHRTLK